MLLGTAEFLLFVSTFFVAWFIWKCWSINGGRSNHGRRYPPCLPALPFVGSLPFLGRLEKLPEYFMKTAEKLGPVVAFYSGRRMAVVLNGKEVITEALVRNSLDFADRPPIYTESNVANVNLLGIGFKPYNESFKKYHKLSMSILKGFGFGVKDVSERRILEAVEEFVDEIRTKEGKPFDVKEMLTAAVSNVIFGILFGKKFRHERTVRKDLLENIDKHANTLDPTFDVAPLVRFIPFYRRKLTESAKAHVEIRRCIAVGVKSSLSVEEEDEDNFVKRFIQIEGSEYDREELFYILRDFNSGSVETTTTTILWAAVFLANNPKVQDRLQKEIDSLIPRDRLPSLDDKQNLPYVEAFILETMRFKTILPLAIPHAVSTDKELNGYFIPKNSMVLINVVSVHMDSKVWKDPEVFRPERFLDEDDHVVGREKIIPFSLGKRACPGEVLARNSLLLYLSVLLHQFDIRPPEGQDSIVVSDVCSIVVAPSAFDVRFIPR